MSGGKNIPAWLSDKKKKALRKDEEYRRRIELIQDFEFPAGCQKIKLTPDGQYIFASGYHPPQVPSMQEPRGSQGLCRRPSRQQPSACLLRRRCCCLSGFAGCRGPFVEIWTRSINPSFLQPS